MEWSVLSIVGVHCFTKLLFKNISCLHFHSYFHWLIQAHSSLAQSFTFKIFICFLTSLFSFLLLVLRYIFTVTFLPSLHLFSRLFRLFCFVFCQVCKLKTLKSKTAIHFDAHGWSIVFGWCLFVYDSKTTQSYTSLCRQCCIFLFNVSYFSFLQASSSPLAFLLTHLFTHSQLSLSDIFLPSIIFFLFF